MGLFDTVLLDPPITCPRCGSDVELQTKLFDPGMITYRIGSILSGSPVLSGILKEQAYCAECRKAEREPLVPVFLVVWHSILAGVELSEGAADARLYSVDRVDLIGWIDEAQRKERDWRQRFRAFYNDVRKWHEHLKREAAKPDKAEPDRASRTFAALFRLPPEILDAPDPLGAILAEHKDTSKEEDGFF
ncbi:MAG: hypothetical protein ACLFPV_05500 [Spirochaetaceae bacterium]